APGRVVLIDGSASMALPVRPGDPAAPTRLDSAMTVLAGLAPERVYRFGDEAVGIPPDDLSAMEATEPRSRIAPALEAARLGGADSVWVVTDGDLGDRVEGLDLAAGLGLGVREVRVAEDVPRAGLAAVRAPRRARAGDTVRIAAEIRATGGEATDSLTVEVRLDGTVLALARVERPTAGRAVVADLPFVPLDPGEESAWRRYEVALEDGADPFGASDRLPAWIEISEASNGAVLVSTVPDWEARYLLPALDRLVLGGARGFLRLADGRYMEMAANPRPVEEDAVRRSLTGARLLVVQASPADMPDWLGDALARHPRALVLSRGPGLVPGAGVRLSGPVPGEWYAMGPVPASPAAALLADVDFDPLPPMTELYAVDRGGAWSVLSANRDRRGESRPLLIAGERGETRWAVSPGADWWRWASRGGPPRRVYDGVMSGVVGWLVEDARSELVALRDVPAAEQPLEWRVRPGVTDLALRVLDEEGGEVFSSTWEAPPERLGTDGLPPGRYEVHIEAEGPEGPVASVRPLEISPDGSEMLPRLSAPPAFLEPAGSRGPAIEGRAPRPVWPFVLAVLVLCAEWAWRHRIGLR
ncbi:MAG: VWA domain-containing protein, partial [Gemmatimonadota bacterium]|nr:VWA domain-containing protein [Gemmatimonadota bacterium]